MDITRIGLLFSTDGPYGAIGRAMLNGALLGLREANESCGAALQPVLANPGGDLARYKLLCSRLIDRGVRHIVGCYTSSSRKELIPLVEKRDALLWYPSHYEGFESAANVIYTGAAPNQHIVPLADHVLGQAAAGHRGPRFFCLGSNYIWAWENNRILREAVLGRGGSIVSERYVPVGEQELGQAIDAILEARPDYVFCTLIGISCWRFFAGFRAACRARGIDQAREIPVLSCSLSEPELAEIPVEARDGHVSSSVYFSCVDSPASRRFVAAYDHDFPAGPPASADAESAYIAVHLLARTLAATGTSDVARVVEAAPLHSFAAPQGEVRLDAQTMHAWLTPRIGRSRADGRFDILYEAARPVAPDPYLVGSGPRLSRVAPSLRIVS